MIFQVPSLLCLLATIIISFQYGRAKDPQHSRKNSANNSETLMIIDCRAYYLSDINDGCLSDNLVNNSRPKFILASHNVLKTFRKVNLGPTITGISCSFNNISDIEPFAISDLPNLITLSLSNNFFTRISSLAFKSNNRSSLPLESLDLSNNKLRTLHADAFKDLPRLTTLQLSRNLFIKLDTSFVRTLKVLTNLQILNLSETGISELPMALKPTVENLKVLDLNGNNFKEVPKLLQHGKKLIKLVLSRNAIANFDKHSFIGLEQLDELDVSFMSKLKKIYPGAFSPLKTLQVLRCHDNSVLDEIHERAFSTNLTCKAPKTMKTLELQHNNLKVLNKNVFFCLKFDSLDIRNNPFNCRCEVQWSLDKTVKFIKSNLKCWQPGNETEFQTKLSNIYTMRSTTEGWTAKMRPHWLLTMFLVIITSACYWMQYIS